MGNKIGNYSHPKLESIIKYLVKEKTGDTLNFPSNPGNIPEGQTGTVPAGSNLNLQINCDDAATSSGNNILTVDGVSAGHSFSINVPIDADGVGTAVTIEFVGSLSTPAEGTIYILTSGTQTTNQASLVKAINGTADTSNITYPTSGVGSSGVQGVTASNGSTDYYVSLVSTNASSASNSITLSNGSGTIWRNAVTMEGGAGITAFEVEGILIVEQGATVTTIPCDFDITKIIAGNAITVSDSAGTNGESGDVTINLDINKLSSGTVADGDLVTIYDINGDGATDGDLRKVTALSIAQLAGGGGGGTPQGSDTQIQYNNAGSFGGIAEFIWNDTNLVISGQASITSGNTAALYFREDDSADSVPKQPKIYSGGTGALTIFANSSWTIDTGQANFGNTTVDINDGNIDGTPIGAAVPEAGTFTQVVLRDDSGTPVVRPHAAGTARLGNSGKEWGDFYIYKDKYIRLGDASGTDLDDVPVIIGYNSSATNPDTYGNVDDNVTGRLVLSSSAGTMISGTVFMRDNLVIELDQPRDDSEVDADGEISAEIAYINFGSVQGATGYGIRWNDGVLDVRNSGDSWDAVGIAGANVKAVDSLGNKIDSEIDPAENGLTSNIMIVGASATKIKKPTTTITTNAQILSVDTDSGLQIGAGSDLQITVSSDDAIFYNQTSGKDIIFQVNESTASSANKEVLRIDGVKGLVGIRTADPEVALDVHHAGSSDPSGLSSGKGGGEVVYFGTAATSGGQIPAPGKLMYLNTSGVWEMTDASSVSTGADSLLAIALGTTVSAGMLIRGFFNGPGYTPNVVKGKALYVSETAGQMVTTRPTATGAYVRIVGYFLNGGDGGSTEQYYFNPDSTWVELN